MAHYQAWFIIVVGAGAYRGTDGRQAFVYAHDEQEAEQKAVERFPELAGKKIVLRAY